MTTTRAIRLSERVGGYHELGGWRSRCCRKRGSGSRRRPGVHRAVRRPSQAAVAGVERVERGLSECRADASGRGFRRSESAPQGSPTHSALARTVLLRQPGTVANSRPHLLCRQVVRRTAQRRRDLRRVCRSTSATGTRVPAIAALPKATWGSAVTAWNNLDGHPVSESRWVALRPGAEQVALAELSASRSRNAGCTDDAMARRSDARFPRRCSSPAGLPRSLAGERAERRAGLVLDAGGSSSGR
jgi:hypothetical protein